ncbi:hypothetical protein MMC29_000491 [Sticta canariensis]|nr:hypothetical protein [Sticta canariensis]
MIFFLWLLFAPFHSYELFIPTSPTATGTAGTPDLGSLLTTQDEAGTQIVLGHGKPATCDYVGDEAAPKACPSSHPHTSVDLNERCKCCDGIEREENDNACIDHDGENNATLGKEDCESDYTLLCCPSDTLSCSSTFSINSPGWDKTDETVLATSAVTSVSKLIEKAATAVSESPPALSQTNDAEPKSSMVKRSSDDGRLDKGDIIAIVIPSVTLLITIVVGWWEKQQVQWLLTCGICGSRKSRHDDSLWKQVWKKLRFWK